MTTDAPFRSTRVVHDYPMSTVWLVVCLLVAGWAFLLDVVL